MSDHIRYSDRPQSRFAAEHMQLLGNEACMIDLDGVIWVPYSKDRGLPQMLVELKPEGPRKQGWFVTQALAACCRLPAALVFELENGLYRVHVATARTGYRPYRIKGDMTMQEWYERVELPIRRRYYVTETQSILDMLEGRT